MAAPTAIERSLFEQLYPDGGWAACAAVMPGKKKGWITQWAWRMGLTEPLGDMDDPTPVPAHDYTAADKAMREWGCVDRTGQLRPIVKAPVLGRDGEICSEETGQFLNPVSYAEMAA